MHDSCSGGMSWVFWGIVSVGRNGSRGWRMLSGRLRGARLYATEGLEKSEISTTSNSLGSMASVSCDSEKGNECFDLRMLDKARNER